MGLKNFIEKWRKGNEFERACRKKSLNPHLLFQVFRLKYLGYEDEDVAEKLAVTSERIEDYVKKIKSFTEEEFKLLYEKLEEEHHRHGGVHK